MPNAFGNNISAYAIKANGSLSPVAGSPFNTGSEPWGVAVDPKGKFVDVTNVQSNNVSAYTINVTSGALTPVAGSPFATGDVPEYVAVDPKGKFAYVANAGGHQGVSAYTIDAASGSLTPVAGSPFQAGSGPVGVAVDPKGKFVYVGNTLRQRFRLCYQCEHRRANTTCGIAVCELAASPDGIAVERLRATSSMWTTKTPTMFPLIRSNPAAARYRR